MRTTTLTTNKRHTIDAQHIHDDYIRLKGHLVEPEKHWRALYDFLLQQGFQLRERYNPNWIPSWRGTDKKPLDCEDGVPMNWHYPDLMDATRLSDKVAVMLKRVVLKQNKTHEIHLARLVCSMEAIESDPRNRCVPVYQIIPVPGGEREYILVMPLLSEWHAPEFTTVGEVLEFCRQMFENLYYLHGKGIAHNDIKWNNILMDAAPLYEHEPHPFMPEMQLDFKARSRPKFTRTERPVNYYLIDFGLSVLYPRFKQPMINPSYGGDTSVPEFRAGSGKWADNQAPIDPFPVDVYRLGNIIRQEFIRGDQDMDISPKKGFDFLVPLIDAMTAEDPARRPNMEEVVQRFTHIVQSLSEHQLRTRIADVDENGFVGWFRDVGHWIRQLHYHIRQVEALPVPGPDRGIVYC